MTKQHTSMIDWRKQRVLAGWRYYSRLLPPEIHDEISTLVKLRMDYLKSKALGMAINNSGK